MTDEVQEEITEEEEIIQEQVEETEETQYETNTEEEPKKKTAEYNFAELRRQREEDKRKAEEMARLYELERQRTNEILELMKQSKKATSSEEKDLIEEELAKLQSDDLATVGNTEKIFLKHSKPSKKKMEELENKLKMMEAQLEEQKLRAKYPDLENVLSKENVDLLKKEEPEIAEMLAKMSPGSKEQIVSTYRWIKRIVPTPTQHEVPLEKKKAEINKKKPLSVQSLGNASAIGNMQAFENGLTKELKAQLWKEMNECSKRG